MRDFNGIVVIIATFLVTVLAIVLSIWTGISLLRLKSNGTSQESNKGIQTIVNTASISSKSGKISEKREDGGENILVIGSHEIAVSSEEYSAYSIGDTVGYQVGTVTVPAVDEEVGSSTDLSVAMLTDDLENEGTSVKEQLRGKVETQVSKNSELLVNARTSEFYSFLFIAIITVFLSILAFPPVLYLHLTGERY